MTLHIKYFHDAEAELADNADEYNEAHEYFVTWITELFAILDNNDSKSHSMPP